MKRLLLQNTYISPIASGASVDRERFLSGIIGVLTNKAGSLTIAVKHSDDGETFAIVTDEKTYVDQDLMASQDEETKGYLITTEVEAESLLNLDIDLVGLKQFICVEVSGEAADGVTLALALGDGDAQPV